MEKSNEITVEVIYAAPTSQHLLTLTIKQENATVQTVIELSGILSLYPEIDLSKQKIGIFSKPCALTDKVNDGDRIEIYRPLLIDPKEARRLKARKPRSL